MFPLIMSRKGTFLNPLQNYYIHLLTHRMTNSNDLILSICPAFIATTRLSSELRDKGGVRDERFSAIKYHYQNMNLCGNGNLSEQNSFPPYHRTEITLTRVGLKKLSLFVLIISGFQGQNFKTEVINKYWNEFFVSHDNYEP